MIEAVTQYKCPVTGKLWPTEKQAKNCAARAKAREKEKLAKKEEIKKLAEEKEFCRNFVRFNAKSPDHAIELLLSKSEEFWGIKLGIYENVNGLYWYEAKSGERLCSSASFTITAKVTDAKLFQKNYRVLEDYWKPSISDFLRFIGFETGSGNPGEFGGYTFSMNVYIPFEEFPIINTNHKLLKIDKEKRSQRNYLRNGVRSIAEITATIQPECEKMHNVINDLENILSNLRNKRRTYIDNFANKYMAEFWDKVNPEPPVNSELEEMFPNVR